MAVYKIFPEKDATVYSAYPNTNTGLDQILEIQNTTSSLNENAQVSRILLQFPLSTIQNVITNYVGNPSGYEAYLRLFIANATSLPDNYTLYVNPISQSWESGTGRFLYNPADENGVTWTQRNNSNNWPSASFAADTTASFLAGNPGGCSWYTLFEDSASFIINDNKDIDAEVTDIVGNFNNLNIPNNGFTPPPQCMPEEFKMEDTIEAYKNFYINDKIKIKKLTYNKLNNKPEWISTL